LARTRKPLQRSHSLRNLITFCLKEKVERHDYEKEWYGKRKIEKIEELN
jgi:hypothetical protein